MSEIEPQTDEPVTFESLKARTADDLRTVAGFLECAAKAAEAGDMDSVEHTLFDQLGLWQQMLLIRFAHRREKLAEERAEATT